MSAYSKTHGRDALSTINHSYENLRLPSVQTIEDKERIIRDLRKKIAEQEPILKEELVKSKIKPAVIKEIFESKGDDKIRWMMGMLEPQKRTAHQKNLWATKELPISPRCKAIIRSIRDWEESLSSEKDALETFKNSQKRITSEIENMKNKRILLACTGKQPNMK